MTVGLETWDPTVFIEFSALVNGIAFRSQINLHYFTQIAQFPYTLLIDLVLVPEGPFMCLPSTWKFFWGGFWQHHKYAYRGSIANNIF